VVIDDVYALRLARRSDVPALEVLIDRSVRGLGGAYYTAAEIDAGLRYVFGVDTQLVEDGTYYLIEHGATVVACGGWSARRTLFGGDQHKAGPDPRLDPQRDAARIRAFFVHPDHARRGLGRRLYQACAMAARAEGFTSFELMATLPGQPLYLALGFETLDPVAVPTPVGVPLPCVRMRRAIDTSPRVP
jgi:GNAT superfamily N-acetyltransferase